MLIFGVGEFADVAYFYFNSASWDVTGFTVDEPKGSFNGLPVIPWKECKPDQIFIAIGYTKMNEARAEKLRTAKSRGFTPVSHISSRANIFSQKIGNHCFILEDNTIQPYVEIGDNCILWSGNHVGHHSKIGDNCFITSHVVISGGCEIGENSFIGVNSSIADHVKIGARNYISMGSKVNKDTHSDAVWHGDKLTIIPSSKI